jgi:hypothetical protein
MHALRNFAMIQHCVGIRESVKGSTSGVDRDSGLGTSRYKSTMSRTVSDVCNILLLIVTACLPQSMFILCNVGNT